MDYVLGKEDGIYYIYSERILFLPKVFESRQASRYLVAVELLSEYKHAAYKLRFVADWLNGLKKEDGKWDMGKSVNDKVYFRFPMTGENKGRVKQTVQNAFQT